MLVPLHAWSRAQYKLFSRIRELAPLIPSMGLSDTQKNEKKPKTLLTVLMDLVAVSNLHFVPAHQFISLKKKEGSL